MKKSISTICILLAGCLWATSGLFGRLFASYGMGSFGITFARFSFAILYFLILILVRDRRLFRASLRDFPYFALIGIVATYLSALTYYLSMQTMSVSATTVLLYTAPFFVILISRVLFGEKLTHAKTAALLMAFSGCCLVSGIFNDDVQVSAAGILFGLLAGLTYAMASILGKYVLNKGYPVVTMVFYNTIFASLGALAAIPLGEPGALSFFTPDRLPVLMLYSLSAYFLPNTLYNFGLSGMEAGRASITVSIEPVVATIFGTAILGEPLYLTGVVGIALVLAAIVLINRNPGTAK